MNSESVQTPSLSFLGDNAEASGSLWKEVMEIYTHTRIIDAKWFKDVSMTSGSQRYAKIELLVGHGYQGLYVEAEEDSYRRGR